MRTRAVPTSRGPSDWASPRITQASNTADAKQSRARIAGRLQQNDWKGTTYRVAIPRRFVLGRYDGRDVRSRPDSAFLEPVAGARAGSGRHTQRVQRTANASAAAQGIALGHVLHGRRRRAGAVRPAVVLRPEPLHDGSDEQLSVGREDTGAAFLGR